MPLPAISRRGGQGGIVLMSSLLAFQGVPRAATYAASKAFVQTFAEGLHAELKGKGIDVVAVAPGPVRSGFGSRANMRLGFTVGPKTVARRALAALGRRVTVRPGLLSKVLEGSLSLLSRNNRVVALGRVMDGLTRHQREGAR